MPITVRQMLRQCSFKTLDGKLFTRKLHDTYELRANIISNNRNNTKTIIVKKYDRGELIDKRVFSEDIDFDSMRSYCNILTF